ncbi:putative bifunctional diguanylate cyclase/phosphodiesterase [Aquipuribacter hungaricus]|uniref:putative bifunctional diguanylate cyclase/phosphodiesterase n=1 Tax=Aquipuribacter hungaricus TaxID=545624 RepID=UPI0030ECF7D4
MLPQTPGVLPGPPLAPRVPAPRQDADDRALADRRLQEAYALTGLAWWEWVTGTGELRWSEGMQRLAGLEALDRAPTIEDWVPLLDPADVDVSAAHEAAALRDGTPYRHVFRIRTPAGELRYLESWSGPLRDADGGIVGLRGATLDVSEREVAQRALAASEAHFRVTFDHAPHGMAMVWLQGERAGRLLRANDAFARLLGRSCASDLDGLGLADWTPHGERRRSRARLRDMAAGRSPGTSYPRRYLRADGSTVHAWVTTAVVDDEQGRPQFAVAHCIDDTERRAHVDQMEQMAHTDALTGLANRAVVDRELGPSPRAGAVTGLLLMDLDRFKLVNDSQGHGAGDALLVQVAGRLRATVPSGCTLARLGGDEFVVVLHQGVPVRHAALGARLVEAVRAPFTLPGGERASLTTSVGIALVGPDSPARDLLGHADLALYEAKGVGRDRVVTYDERLQRRTERRVRAETLLRAALAAADDGLPCPLRVVLQPVVALRDETVVSAEALVRLADPDGVDLHTGDLVEVAEETGLVVRLDRWVMSRVVALLAEDEARRRRGAPALLPARVAVNVSGRSIEEPGFAARVALLLRTSGVAPARLAVELTETSLLHDSTVVEEAIAELVDGGVAVGIDDFGTGYSALAYLPRFPLSFLKIDMSFVRRLGTERRADAVVAAVVELAHAHDLAVVAEGVETVAQAGALRRMGCEHGQGWLFGRPAPAPTG